jgi:hypothetical protein
VCEEVVDPLFTGLFSSFRFTTAGLVMGLSIGIAQWLVLRRILPKSFWWIGLTTMVSFGVGRALGNSYNSYLGGAAVGILVGIAQWWVLSLAFSQAGWWIPANIVGWVAGWTLGEIAQARFGEVTFIVGPILAGIIMGALLVWLTRQPIPQAAH